MTVDWTEKYRPPTFFEVRGNDKARDVLAEWTEMWDDHRETAVVHGSPDVGETLTAHALVVGMGWETVELNTSDQRAGDVIERFAGRAAKNATLAGFSAGMSARQLVTLGEADNIHDNYDRDGTSTVIRLVKPLSQLVVLIVNGFYDTSHGLRNVCQEVEFRDVFTRSTVPVPRDICCKEGPEFEPDASDRIVEMNSGDPRPTVSDPQAIAESRERIAEEDAVMGDRNRFVDLFESLDAIPKEESAQNILYTTYDVDETPDDLTRWIEDKMSLVYELSELARACDFLANVDHWPGRVRATQNYPHRRYTTGNLVAGVVASRDRTCGGWTHYGDTPYRSTRDKTRDTVVRKIAQNNGLSMAIARRKALSYFSAIIHHCKPRELTVAMVTYCELNESHASLITGSDEMTNKVQSIVKDAGEFRKELTEEHATGTFAGMEDAPVDGDAATDDGGDGMDNTLDRDTNADVDESTESDDSDAATNDRQLDLDDSF